MTGRKPARKVLLNAKVPLNRIARLLILTNGTLPSWAVMKESNSEVISQTFKNVKIYLKTPNIFVLSTAL